MKLAEVTSIDVNRTKTEMDEFNRVLGGGVVPGSLVLIGGDPGIGKSTLLLQVSTQLSHQGTVLYVSGEESAEQIKLRAERLGDIDSEFYLYAETNMQNIRTEIEKIKGRHFDLAFVPLDPRLEAHYADGLLYFLERVDCNAVFPIHYWGEPEVIRRFLTEYPQYSARIKNTETAKGEEI